MISYVFKKITVHPLALCALTNDPSVPGPVGSPKCYLTNSGKDVELRWNAPAAPNGPIVEYRVMYDGEDIGGELTVPGTATSTPISGVRFKDVIKADQVKTFYNS